MVTKRRWRKCDYTKRLAPAASSDFVPWHPIVSAAISPLRRWQDESPSEWPTLAAASVFLAPSAEKKKEKKKKGRAHRQDGGPVLSSLAPLQAELNEPWLPPMGQPQSHDNDGATSSVARLNEPATLG